MLLVGVAIAFLFYCVGVVIAIAAVEQPDLPPYPAPGWGQSHIHVVTEEEPW